MKTLLIILVMSGQAVASDMNQAGVSPSTDFSTLTITGTGATCLAVDGTTLVADCNLNKVGISTNAAGNGNLRVRAGTGNGGGTVPILIHAWTGSSNTHTTAGNMLAHQFIIPANTIKNDGDSIRVWYVARATTTDISKGVWCTYAGDAVEIDYFDTTNEIFTQDDRLLRSSASNLKGTTTKNRSGQGGSVSSTMKFYDTINGFAEGSDLVVECYLRSNGTSVGGEPDMIFQHVEAWLDTQP